MQIKIVYSTGDTSIFEDVKTVEKIVCQGFKEEFWQVFHNSGNITERRCSEVKEIILK